MLVDRISCRLDSLALERENGIIDTLLCIHYHSHSFMQEQEREEQSRELVKNSMYSHRINRKILIQLPWMCLILLCCCCYVSVYLLPFMHICYMLHM
jgi:hypothetical protein